MSGPLKTIFDEIPPLLKPVKEEALIDFYEKLFNPIKDFRLNVLEIGTWRGGSALMFGRYLKNARILTVDIKDPPAEYYQAVESDAGLRGRLFFAGANQEEPRTISGAVVMNLGTDQMDVIIDDGCHFYGPTMESLFYLFRAELKPGGIYIVED